MHLTCRIAAGLPSLRDPRTAELLMEYLARVCEREGFRVVEYSILGNHIHMICEAASSEALTAAMNGILSGMARLLNHHWGRKGKVFADRYHVESIATPTQCRNALCYVLMNAKKHGCLTADASVDAWSTARWFAFADYPDMRRDAKPAAHPRSWLLRKGWRRAKGKPLSLHDRPRLPKRARKRLLC